MKKIIFLFITSFSLFAQDPVVIMDGFESAQLNESLEYFEDETRDLSIQDIISFPEQNFRSLGSYQNLGFSKSAFWVKLRLKNEKKKVRHPLFVLRADYPEIDSVDYYQVSDSGELINSGQTGTMMPVTTRSRPDENIVFLISIPHDSIHTLYLRMTSETPIMLDFSLHSMDQYLRVYQRSTLLNGIFIGILLLAIGYYSILYFRIKDLTLFTWYSREFFYY